MHEANSSDYEVCHQLPPTIGSPQSLGKVRTWLEDCTSGDTTSSEPVRRRSSSSDSQIQEENSHKDCTHHCTPGYRPTRLLDIGDLGSDTCKLCTTSQEISDIAYTTLSYCWGATPFLKLTQRLLSDFQAGKAVLELPQLFQDAILVTKYLGFRYIWIDALCIIQDSENDFKKQIASMAKVYGNTAINIIAANCRSPFESLFKARRLRDCHVGILPSWNMTDPHVTRSTKSIMEQETFQRQLDNAPTQHRGWILQERVLPSRRLYFLPNQLYFSCRVSQRCEVFPKRVPNQLATDCQTYDLPPPGYLDPDKNGAYSSWGNLAKSYNMCLFTYPTDKMIALTGLIDVFQKATDDEYVFGLWKSRLPWTLCWEGSPNRPPRRTTPNIAPTWSWLSIDGEIFYSEQTSLGEHAFALCEVLDISTTLLDARSTSDTTHPGLLTIRAISFNTRTTSEGDLELPSCLQSTDHASDFLPDDTHIEMAGGTTLTMAILTADADCANFSDDIHPLEGLTRWCITALVLQHDEVKDLYRRVGTVRIRSHRSDNQVKSSPLLNAFGLTISNAFGDVAVIDESNWRILRII